MKVKKFIYKLNQILSIPVLIVFSFVLLYLMAKHQNKVEKQYKFNANTPTLKRHPCKIEPIMIDRVDSGGAFAQAGIEPGDIIFKPRFWSTGQFYRYLKKPTGDTIVLYVIPIKDFKLDCSADMEYHPIPKTIIAP